VASINEIRGLQQDLRDELKVQPFFSVCASTIGWRAQQVACHPSGNGISGQANPLSLAASGGLPYVIELVMKSSWGTGATAAFTASSSRSNSASLIALSRIRAPSVAKLLFFEIEQIIQIVTVRRTQAGLVAELLTGPPGNTHCIFGD
jgi:hypothetical protein